MKNIYFNEYIVYELEYKNWWKYEKNFNIKVIIRARFLTKYE